MFIFSVFVSVAVKRFSRSDGINQLRSKKYDEYVTVFWSQLPPHVNRIFLRNITFSPVTCLVVPLLYPVRSRVKRIMDVIPRGTELELQLRRGFGQALYTCNNIHIKCTGVYWAQAEKYCYK